MKKPIYVNRISVKNLDLLLKHGYTVIIAGWGPIKQGKKK